MPDPCPAQRRTILSAVARVPSPWPWCRSRRRLQARGRAQDRVHLRGHRQGRRLERGPGFGARGGRAGARPDGRGHRERAGGGDRAEERDRPLRQARLQHHRRAPPTATATASWRRRSSIPRWPSSTRRAPPTRPTSRASTPAPTRAGTCRHGCGRGQQERQARHPGRVPVGVVNWDVNAFTLGARAIDPDAQVTVVYTNSWWDPVKEEQVTRRCSTRAPT